MVLPIIAGGAGAYAAYKLYNEYLADDETASPYRPDKKSFEYGGLGEDYFGKRAEKIPGRQAPQADMRQYEGGRMAQMEGRGAQGEALGHYRSMINNPNSFAQQQLKAGADANFRQQLSAGRSAGYNPAAMRAAGQVGGQIGAETNRQAQMLQVQETNAAVQGLAQTAMQQRAQDLQLMGMDAQTAQYQAMLELQQGALNDKMQLGLYGLGQNAAMAQQQGGMNYEGLMAGGANAANMQNAQNTAANNAAGMSAIGTGASWGAGSMGGSGGGTEPPVGGGDTYNYYGSSPSNPNPPPPSDERSKQQIQELRTQNSGLRDMLSSVGLTPRQESRPAMQPAPGRQALAPGSSSQRGEFADEAAFQRAAAQDYENSRGALLEQRAVEEQEAVKAAQARAYAEWAKQQAELESARRGGTPVVGPPSDERSKQRIQELEGIVGDYRALLGGLGESQAQRPDLRTPGEVPTARFADVTRSDEARAMRDEIMRDLPARRESLRGALSDEELRMLRERAILQGEMLRGVPERSRGTESGFEPGVFRGTPPDLGSMRGEPFRGSLPDLGSMRGEPFRQAAPTAGAMSTLPSKSWEYGIEPYRSQYPGEHLSPTAQDLEKNPATAGTVYTGDDGLKRPDPTLLSLQNTQAISELARLQAARDDALRQYQQLESAPAFVRPEMRR